MIAGLVLGIFLWLAIAFGAWWAIAALILGFVWWALLDTSARNDQGRGEE